MADDFFLAVTNMMNGVILHADREENLPYIAELLFKNNANAIIIRKGGVPEGIITSKDILKGLLTIDKNAEDIFAKEIMSSPLITIEHNRDVTDAREIMIKKNIQKLPVMKDFEVVGLMVQSDLIRDTSWYKRI